MISEHSFAGLVSPVRPAPAGLAFAQIVVGHVYGVPLGILLAPTRQVRRAAEARQVAMYLAHVALGMSLADVARAFGRDRSTASHACRRVEGLREDREIDRRVAWLEVLVRNASGSGGGAAARARGAVQ